MPTYTPLQSIALTSDSSTVTFSSIPQDYTDIEIQINGRGSHSANVNFYYRINEDSTSSYYVIRLQGTGSSAVSNYGSANTLGYIGYADGTDSTSGIFGSTKIMINNYANSTTYKTLFSKGATPGTSGTAAYFINLYKGSTSPIQSITLGLDAGNWVAGSTFDLYGVKAGAPSALGGDLITTDGSYWYHTFRSTQLFIPQKALTVDYLVVAGGAGGGVASGGGAGGGGAGGLRSTVTATGGGGTLETALSLTAQTYTVTVGAGGVTSQSAGQRGGSGNDSVFSTITAKGGAGGGGQAQNPLTGGGAGGGGAGNTGGVSGSAGTANQGYAGGSSQSGDSPGGGGGGSGSAGANGGAQGGNGGAGGNGVAVSITGTSVTYAGGGGGGNDTRRGGTFGAGGSGGGGAGGGSGSNINPVAGTANTGGGGGGTQTDSNGNPGAVANGGSGIVIVRYPV